MDGSGRASPNSDGGEAVCGGGVNVMCGQEMDGTQAASGRGNERTAARVARLATRLPRGIRPQPLRSRPRRSTAHRHHMCVTLVSSEEIAADEAGKAGEPTSRPGQEGLAADLRRPTQIKTTRNTIVITDYIIML